jgi:predicted Na+-dependent transporter
MTKEKKGMIFLVVAIALLDIGTILLTPSWWILGLILGLIGILMFGFGVYWSIGSVIKSIKQIYNEWRH